MTENGPSMERQPPDQAAPEETGPYQKSRRGQIIATVLTLAVIVLVFAFLFPQFANYEDAWAAIQEIAFVHLVWLLGITLALILVYPWPYPASIPGLRYGPAFSVRQTSFAISNTIPGGGAFGIALQYGMLGSYGVGPAPATGGIAISSVWNFLVTLALPVFAALGLVASGERDDKLTLAAAGGFLLLLVLIGALAFVMKSEAAARALGSLGDRIVTWTAARFRRQVDLGLADKLVDFQDTTGHVVRSKWLSITASNTLVQLLQFAVFFVALLGVLGTYGDTIGPIEAFAAFAFARLATFIPITPGGLGTVDAAMVAILAQFGVPNEEALAAVLVWRALTYFPQVFIGALTFILWRRKQRKAGAAF